MDKAKKHEIYDAIREDIMSHRIKPGALLNEEVLAKQYGVSRTPIREALHMLAFEKLVSAFPRTGYLVNELTVREVQECFHLRELLEGEAARLAAARITENEINHLKAVEIGVPPHVEQMNRDFHLTIAEASGSQRLYRLIEQMLDESRRMLLYDPYMILPPQDHKEHGPIIQALHNRDAVAAERAIRQHIARAKSRVLERF